MQRSEGQETGVWLGDPIPVTHYGRDKKRRVTTTEARELYERAQGKCQRCGNPLDANWHASHLVAHTNGGATLLENMQAWCRGCNLSVGARDVMAVHEPTLRGWQAEHLQFVLELLFDQGMATVQAAPGAGKTVFAGIIAKRLLAAGLIERVVVVVPNKALLGQWTRALGGTLQIHLDPKPRDGFLEISDTVGCVVTYQSLNEITAACHHRRAQEYPTLVIFDEVHHIGDEASWGKAVRHFVGNPGISSPTVAAVLNMTGTLWRTTNKHKIGTIKYESTIENGQEVLTAHADVRVSTRRLIGSELRPVDLHAYSTTAQVIDLKAGEITTGTIADLDKRQRAAVKAAAFNHPDFLAGFCLAAVQRLVWQQEALGEGEHLKMLYVATDQNAARLAADTLNKIAHNRHFARLVISDEPGNLATLSRAAEAATQCAIVTVNMVTEGFDCPEISTIAYASNVVTPLRVAQVMARAMRITRTERQRGDLLPAQILIPDDPILREAFEEGIAEADVHSFTQSGSVTACFPPGSGDGGGSGPRFQLLDIGDIQLRESIVLGEEDGTVAATELATSEDRCRALGIPVVYAPRVVVFARRTPLAERVAEQTRKQTREAGPRERNEIRRHSIARLARTMAHHVEHDPRYTGPGAFQAKANDAAGVPNGERDMASEEQLATIEAWMRARLREHFDNCDESTPKWMN